jgi:hypothetical protein
MIENHVAEVQKLQYIASGHCLRLQSLLESKSQDLVVLKICLQSSLSTIEILSGELTGTIRVVGISLNYQTTKSAVRWLLWRVDITSSDLANSEAEDTQQLLPEVW